MHEVTFTVETLTPLFLAGADQEAAELRAPSFRGVLRYWLRALLGGCLNAGGRPTLADIRRREEDIFGKTDQGSAVLLRLNPAGMRSSERFQPEPRDARGRVTGRDYLLWSMAEMGPRPARQSYPAGGTFTLTVSMCSQPTPTEFAQKKALFDQAIAAFWLLAYLGGLGARSRRCAGSLAVAEAKNWNNDHLRFQVPDTPDAFRTFLHDGLVAARHLCGVAGQTPTILTPEFDVLAPGACRIWVLQDDNPWARPDQALRAIGEKFLEFRNSRPPDDVDVAKWLNGERISTIHRAVFGLPIQFRYKNGPSGFVQGEHHDRRASPLLLRVAKLGGAEPRYVGIAVLFKSQFLQNRERLKSRDRTKRPIFTQPPAGYGLIEQWVRDSFKNPLEVPAW